MCRCTGKARMYEDRTNRIKKCWMTWFLNYWGSREKTVNELNNGHTFASMLGLICVCVPVSLLWLSHLLCVCKLKLRWRVSISFFFRNVKKISVRRFARVGYLSSLSWKRRWWTFETLRILKASSYNTDFLFTNPQASLSNLALCSEGFVCVWLRLLC